MYAKFGCQFITITMYIRKYTYEPLMTLLYCAAYQ